MLGGAIEGTDSTFLQRLYERRLADSSDAVVSSLQRTEGPRLERPDGWYLKYDFKDGIPRMREVMKENGDGEASVWLTELGWTACTDGS